MYRVIRSVLIFFLVAVFVGCEYWNKDMLGYLEYWSETVQMGKVEVSDATIQKNDAGADTIPVAATPTIAAYVINPKSYELLAEIGDSSSADKSVRVSDSAVQSKAQVVAHEATMLKVQLGSADGSLEHTEFRVDFEAIRKDTMQSSGKVIGVTLRYNTPPVAPTPVVWNYDSSQYEVVKAGEKWEADRDGILYWAYDDSITEETDPNCAKWFSINGTRHLVADRKEPNVQVDGLSVFKFNTNYGGTSVAAVDSEGISSPVIASGQAVPPATYVIKYDGNGADGGTAPASQNKTQYTDITLATNSGGLTRIGYRFSGWNTTRDGTGTTYSAGATYSADESVTLYAKWEVVNTVTFSKSGAVDHGDSVTLTPPVGATIYYRVQGKDEQQGAQGQFVTIKLYNETNMPPSPTGVDIGIPESGSVTITAYARYADGTQSTETTGTFTLKQYTVSYDGNGYTSGDVPAQQSFYSGGSVQVQGDNGLVKTGYTFTGWLGGDGQPYSQGNVYDKDKNLTLTAQWRANTYTVNFVGNGGGGSMDPQQFTYNTAMSLTKNTFTRAGYTFEGWKDNKGEVYTDEEEVKNLTTEWNGIVTLTAQWGCQLQDSAQVPSDAPSTGSSRYVDFGYWPQTVKAADVTVYTGLSKKVGIFTYYLGSDSNYYVQRSGNYYKVEPIRWRVLTDNYIDADGTPTGNALLLAEKILTGGIDWDANVVVGNITQSVAGNKYIWSNIRRWLNGNTEEGDISDYKGTPGFLQTAFTTDAQGKIAPTIVNNTADSTTPTNGGFTHSPFIGGNTTDKIFLLSMREATTAIYGFAESFDNSDSARSRVPTDYAKATGATGGWWWLRSSFYESSSTVRTIHSPGNSLYKHIRNDTDGGFVPALCIPADQLPLP